MEDVVVKISESISDLLNINSSDIYDAVRIVLSEYQVSKATNELLISEQSIEERAYKMYFVAKHTEGLSEKSLAYYRDRLSYIFSVIGKPFSKITSDDVRLYFARRGMVDKISIVTMNNERRVLSSFYSWLTAEEYISKNPMTRIGNIKEGKKIKKPFSEEEIELIRKNTNGLRNKAMIEFLFSTGVRVSELISVKIKDIDFNNSSVLVIGKGSKERYVYLNAKAKLSLKEYIDYRKDDCEYAFCTKIYPYKKLKINSVAAELKKIGEISKIDNVHPHRFRRTMATLALNRGIPIDQVKDMLGHEKIETTTIYAKSNIENLAISHKKHLN